MPLGLLAAPGVGVGPETRFTQQLKTNVNAADWRTALGVVPGGATSPGGVQTSVQWQGPTNAFGGDTNFVYNPVTHQVTLYSSTNLPNSSGYIRSGNLPVTPQMFGAVTGVNDEIPIQAAIDFAAVSSNSVYIPSGLYNLAVRLNGYDNVRIFGDGIGKTVLAIGAINENCIQFIGKTNFLVADMTLQQTGTWVPGTQPTNNNCVLLSGCSDGTVKNCEFSKFTFGGAMLYNSSDCTVEDCVVTTGANFSDLSIDRNNSCVYLCDGGNRNKIVHNLFSAETAFGVHFTFVYGNASSDDNVVADNTIRGMHWYGIVLYDKPNSHIRRTKVVNNIIENIDGDMLLVGYDWDACFGMGIYCLYTEGTEISGNTVRNCGLYTRTSSLTPGGIGINSDRAALITGNQVLDCYYNGIYCMDYLSETQPALYPTVTNASMTIANNRVSGLKRLSTTGTALAGSANYAVASTNGFRTNDIVTINLAGNGQWPIPLSTYIMAVPSPTSITLSNALITSVTNTLVYTWGPNITIGNGTAASATVTVASTNGFYPGAYVTVWEGGSLETNMVTRVASISPGTLTMTRPAMVNVTNTLIVPSQTITRMGIGAFYGTNWCVNVVGNTVDDVVDFGMVFDNNIDVNVTGNTLRNCPDDILIDAVHSASIVGNTFGPPVSLGTQVGVLVYTNARNVSITENTFDTRAQCVSARGNNVIIENNTFANSPIGVYADAQPVINKNRFVGVTTDLAAMAPLRDLGTNASADVSNLTSGGWYLAALTNNLVVTNLTGGHRGQEITLYVYSGTNTVTLTNKYSMFKFAQRDWVGHYGDSISLVYDPLGGTWTEKCRDHFDTIYFGARTNRAELLVNDIGTWIQAPGSILLYHAATNGSLIYNGAAFYPSPNGTVDLGTSGLHWKDAYVLGNMNASNFVAIGALSLSGQTNRLTDSGTHLQYNGADIGGGGGGSVFVNGASVSNPNFTNTADGIGFSVAGTNVSATLPQNLSTNGQPWFSQLYAWDGAIRQVSGDGFLLFTGSDTFLFPAVEIFTDGLHVGAGDTNTGTDVHIVRTAPGTITVTTNLNVLGAVSANSGAISNDLAVGGTLNLYGTNGYAPVTNVKFPPYNADSSGSTDATAAIQSALNDTTNGVVYLPYGTYKINGTLHLSSYRTLRGGLSPNGNKPELYHQTAGTWCIQADGSDFAVVNVLLSGLGTGSGLLTATNANSTNFRIENVHCRYLLQGMDIQSAWDGEIIAPYIDHCTTGIVISNANAITVRDAHIMSNPGVGILCYGAADVNINGTVEQNAIGILFTNGTFHATVSKSWFENNTNYSILADGGASVTSRLSISDSTFSSPFASSTNVVLNNCQMPVLRSCSLGNGIPYSVDSNTTQFITENIYSYGSAGPLVDNSISGITISSNIVVKGGSVTADSMVIGATNVVAALSTKAQLAGPVFSGDPQVPNVVLTDSDSTIANTAFVKSNITAIKIVGSLGTTADGGGSAVTTGVKGYLVVPYTGYITGWSIVSDGASPTCTWDVWKIASGTALPTVSNTITAAAKPDLSTGNVVRSTAVSTWGTGTNLTAGDIVGFNVDAATVGTRMTLTLETLR